jgi:hypothetical protein
VALLQDNPLNASSKWEMPAKRPVARSRYAPAMRPDERAVLERAIRRVTEQAANAHAIVAEAIDAGLDG